jgi:hypothetical protein
MPFINGRYHVNPIMGEALEAAREAEAALAALQLQASRDSSGNAPNGDDGPDADDPSSSDSTANAGPIHHVEIEATELVPSNSGRATRGFVARVHRASSANAGNTPQSAGRSAPPPETHVFSDHRDLVNFLGDALAPDPPQR